MVREEARRDGRRSTGSLLPYCICDDETGGLALPLGWDELDTLRNGDVTAATFAAYLAVHGDAFARERERIGAQSFGDRALTREAASSDALDAPAPSPKGISSAPRSRSSPTARRTMPTTFSRRRSHAACYPDRRRGSTSIRHCTNTSNGRSARAACPSSCKSPAARRSGSTVPPTPSPPSRCRPCRRGARPPRSMPRSRCCATARR